MSINFGGMASRTGDWDWLKTMAVSKALVLQFEATPKGYRVWGYDGPEVLTTLLADPADLSDFETNFQALCNGPIAPKTDEGAIYATLLPGKTGRTLVVTGVKFTSPANTTTHEDKSFPQTREIQGAAVEVNGNEEGDYIEVSLRGDLGEGEIEVGKFGETIYIPPSGKIDQIVSEGTVSFPSGFKLRASYTAVNSGSTRKVYIDYRMRK